MNYNYVYLCGIFLHSYIKQQWMYSFLLMFDKNPVFGGAGREIPVYPCFCCWTTLTPEQTIQFIFK